MVRREGEIKKGAGEVLAGSGRKRKPQEEGRREDIRRGSDGDFLKGSGERGVLGTRRKKEGKGRGKAGAE